MDGDLQDTPETLPQFIKKWEEGYDVVYATRINRERVSAKASSLLMVLPDTKNISNFNSSRCRNLFTNGQKVIDVLKSMPERNRHISGLRGYIGFNQIGIPVEREEGMRVTKSINYKVSQTRI